MCDFIYNMSKNRQKKPMLLIVRTVIFIVGFMTKQELKRRNVLFLDLGAVYIGVCV